LNSGWEKEPLTDYVPTCSPTTSTTVDSVLNCIPQEIRERYNRRAMKEIEFQQYLNSIS